MAQELDPALVTGKSSDEEAGFERFIYHSTSTINAG
jgi:hypothetical protein